MKKLDLSKFSSKELLKLKEQIEGEITKRAEKDKAIEEVKKTIALLKKLNIGIIITDHNVKEALSIVEFGYIIYNGEIIKSGSPKEITSDKFVKKIYLGNNYQ